MHPRTALARGSYSDARFHKEVDAQTGFRTSAVICQPLLDGRGQLVAVLQAINPLHGGAFSGRELQLLGFMRMPTSIALLNARLHSGARAAKAQSGNRARRAGVIGNMSYITASTTANAILFSPQTGHIQLSGSSSNGVAGGIPFSGAPRNGS